MILAMKNCLRQDEEEGANGVVRGTAMDLERTDSTCAIPGTHTVHRLNTADIPSHSAYSLIMYK